MVNTRSGKPMAKPKNKEKATSTPKKEALNEESRDTKKMGVQERERKERGGINERKNIRESFIK